jgi:hypothetical protein
MYIDHEPGIKELGVQELAPSLPEPRALRIALWYARKRGWAVLPVHSVRDGGCTCGKPACSSPGKHPRLLNGVLGASRDDAVIREWWRRWPDANVGIATGAVSGIAALDVDIGKGGEQSLAELIARHGEYGQTVECITGSGGRHLVFAYPGTALPNKVGFAAGLDVRGDGGYIVTTPSLHQSGGRYTWKPGFGPHDIERLAPVPDWLLRLITAPQKSLAPVPSRASKGDRTESWQDLIPEGTRNVALTSIGGLMRRYGMGAQAISAALLAENEERCDPPLDEDEVLRIARSVTRYMPEAELPPSRNPELSPSLSLNRGTTRTPIEVWKQLEPAPRRYVVDGLIPEGATTILYGDGGQGKSYVALYLTTLACLGLPFADRTVKQQVCLYLDAELEVDELTRRAYSVARGLGLDKPPEGLLYYRLDGPLSSKPVQEQVASIVELCGATFIVLDSLTIGTYGADPTAAQDMTRVLQYLNGLGTVLAIDHIAKPQPGANLSGYRPFGSAFKYNLARSAIQVVGAEGGGVALQQTKHNFGPKSEPVCLGVDFSDDMVRYTSITAADDLMAGIADHLPTIEQVKAELLASGEAGATIEHLAQALGLAEKTVKNKLTTLKKQGRAEPLGGGRWKAITQQ